MGAVVGVGELSTQTEVEPGRSVIRVSGECDMNSCDELLAAMVAAIDHAPVVVVDLAGLTFMDSSGISVLVVAHQRACGQGRVLSVTGATGVVAKVLQL